MTLQEIELRLSILDEIIKQAIAEGDERWKTTARPQAEQLNEQRAILLKSEQSKSGNVPTQTFIQSKIGVMGARDGRG